jgi:pimeloyl-ACP methyl ester carboxylesterase
LVGHSYGGSVITNVASGADNVKALVHVAGYAPDTGENAFNLTGKFPGSTLPGAFLAQPIALPDGAHDLFLQQDKFRSVFAADVPENQTRLIAATQRPVTDVALKGASDAPAWKNIPCWFICGSAHKVIPQPYMRSWHSGRTRRKPLS